MLLPAAERFYTLDEYVDLEWPDGYRYELVAGYLVVTPPPNVGHQLLLKYLLRALDDYLLVQPLGVAIPGVGLRMAGNQVRIPDLIVSDGPLTESLLITRPPLVAVEILSPGTKSTDRHAKSGEYAAFGITEYWLADAGTRKLEMLGLRGGTYHPIKKSRVLPGFTFS